MVDPHEHARRLAEGDERPFMDDDYREMLGILEASSDDVFTLFALVCECNIRVRKNDRSKAQRVLEQARPLFLELAALEFPDEPDGVPGVTDFGSTEGWPQQGLLTEMGYRVGNKDPGVHTRHAILKRVFQGPLVPVFSQEYMEGWGRDETLLRLYKLAWSIASFADLRLRKLGGVPDPAVQTWIEDLEWLRVAFYNRHFAFPWPSID